MLTRIGASTVAFLVFMAAVSWLSFDAAFTVTSLILLLILAIEGLRFGFSLKKLRLEFSRLLSVVDVSVGEEIEVKLMVKNRGGLTIGPLGVKDVVPHGFDVISDVQRAMLRLNPGEVATVRYVVKPLERGEHCFEKIKIYAFDSLMLFWASAESECVSHVKVYPPIPTLEAISALNQRFFRKEYAEKSIDQGGLGLEFHRIREYSPGDDHRFIAWKTMAKSPVHAPMTKEYEKEESMHVVVAFQTGSSMNDGPFGGRKIDKSVEAALALTYAGAENGDVVSLAFHRGLEAKYVSGSFGFEQTLRALAELYDVQPAEEPSFDELIEKIAQATRKRSLVLLIVDAGYPNTLNIDEPMRLRKMGHNVHVLFLDTTRFTRITAGEKGGVPYEALEPLMRREREHLRELTLPFTIANIPPAICGPDDLINKCVEVYTNARKRRK